MVVRFSTHKLEAKRQIYLLYKEELKRGEGGCGSSLG
jgi:hypothetical protein